MKAYLLVTGTIFGLIAGAHISRMVLESRLLARDPFFVALTLLSAALCVWSVQLIRSPAAHPKS